MTSIHSIAAPAVAPDLLDARDSLDVLGEKIRLVHLALHGLRASGSAVTVEMIDPLIALTSEMQEAKNGIAARAAMRGARG